MSLKNKVAIVTGAGQGIGRGIALALAKAKYQVVVSDIDANNCRKVAKELSVLGAKSLAVKCDVSDKAEVVKLFKQTMKQFGRLDILVNNAGIFPFVAFEQMTEADWDKVIDVNLKSVFLCSQEAAKVMATGGRIINTSSIASVVGFAGLVHYCASKGGVSGMIRA
ncbi:MAG TPA: SDR family NAD(P)-dependent oxidoreductase, partial [bacterium]|nr:SDR family NAD(P)-dependent oxidoreductase [bacterium]HPW39556.1 SDR family NAD(P)-dependent oxidoreductase [bacterium]